MKTAFLYLPLVALVIASCGQNPAINLPEAQPYIDGVLAQPDTARLKITVNQKLGETNRINFCLDVCFQAKTQLGDNGYFADVIVPAQQMKAVEAVSVAKIPAIDVNLKLAAMARNDIIINQDASVSTGTAPWNQEDELLIQPYAESSIMLLGGAKFSVPAGAVDKTKIVYPTERRNAEFSPLYDFYTDSIQLQKPATVSIPLDNEKYPIDLDASSLRLSLNEGKLESGSLDKQTLMFTATTNYIERMDVRTTLPIAYVDNQRAIVLPSKSNDGLKPQYTTGCNAYEDSQTSYVQKINPNFVVMQMSGCAAIYPYVYIIAVNLKNTKTNIRLLYDKIPAGTAGGKYPYYPLRRLGDRISDFNTVSAQKVAAAMNGPTWESACKITYGFFCSAITDKGVWPSPGNGVFRTSMYDAYTKVASRLSDWGSPPVTDEAMLMFSQNTGAGISAKRASQGTNSPNLPNVVAYPLNYTAVGSTSTILKPEFTACSHLATGQTFGYAAISPSTLFFIGSSFKGNYTSEAICPILRNLGVTDAIHLDGDTASQLYYYGTRVNPYPNGGDLLAGTERATLVGLAAVN